MSHAQSSPFSDIELVTCDLLPMGSVISVGHGTCLEIVPVIHDADGAIVLACHPDHVLIQYVTLYIPRYVGHNRWIDDELATLQAWERMTPERLEDMVGYVRRAIQHRCAISASIFTPTLSFMAR